MSSSYDPYTPIVRDPRSKGDRREAAKEMGSIIALLMRAHGADSVDEDDLLKAGFTIGEIHDCIGEATRIANKRLAPRQIERRAA